MVEDFKKNELLTVYRQSEKEFVDFLDRVRTENVSDKDIEYINKRVKNPENEDNIIILTATNKRASEINLKKLNIKINNQINKINPQEKKILEKMLSSPGKVFSRDDIGKIIKISKERSIDVMITRLRQKVESNPKNPKYLQTIRGSGYVLWIE